MGTKFRPGIDGQLEPASIRDFDLLYHQRNEPDRRAAVSGTAYLRQAPARKKNTILDRSSARRSCGLNWMRRSFVSTAHPPSRWSSAIHWMSVVPAGNLSLRAANSWVGYKCCSERGIAGLRLWSTSSFTPQVVAQNRLQTEFQISELRTATRPRR